MLTKGHTNRATSPLGFQLVFMTEVTDRERRVRRYSFLSFFPRRLPWAVHFAQLEVTHCVMAISSWLFPSRFTYFPPCPFKFSSNVNELLRPRYCILSCSLHTQIFGNERQCQERSNYRTIALISYASKVMLKILQPRLQQYVNHELPDVQVGFRKGRGTRDQIANIC